MDFKHGSDTVLFCFNSKQITKMTYLEHITANEPEMAEKLETIAKMMVNGRYSDHRAFMDLCFNGDSSKVDSAYPQPYADQIHEIYPNFRKGNYCFSYIENRFGELINLNDRFMQWIFNKN
jgi:hypothetical protein